MEVQAHHERVTLSREDLNLVDRQRLGVLAVGFDNGHCVACDREDVVGVTGDADQPEPVAGKARRCDQGMLDPCNKTQRTASP